MMSLDNALAEAELRGVGRPAPSAGWARPTDEIDYVCELKIDGLAISHPLRGRPLRPGRHPRRRPRRRGRHAPTSPPSPQRARASCSEGAPEVLEVRGEVYMPVLGLRGAQRQPGRGGLTARSSTRATRPRARCARRTPPITASRDLSLWTYQLGEIEGGPAFRRHHETLELLADARLPSEPGDRARCPTSATCYAVLPALAGPPPRPRLRDRRRRGEGRRPRPPGRAGRHVARRPAGPSPTSSRPRSARRSCATSSCRSGAPARPRPSPCSSRCSSAAPTSVRPPCTTRTRCRSKDVRPGDTVIVRNAGDVIPEVVGPVLADRPARSRPWKFPTKCPVPAAPPSCAPRARPTPAASNPSARPRCTAPSSTSPSQAPWTSRASASSGCAS